MLPLLRGPLPAPEEGEPHESDTTRQLVRRFARSMTLHRQRLSVISSNTLHRRRQTRNCASRRRQVSRTRQQQTGHEQQLDLSIRALQADIASLERSAMLRDSATVLWRTNYSAVALDLTREYYQQFKHGYDSTDTEHCAIINCFMASVFRSDIFCRDFQGILAFLDQWEKYTTLHQGLEIKLQSMRVVESDDDPQCAVTVHANAEMDLTFTDDTVKVLYPALFEKSLNNAEESEIIHNLVGSTGTLPVELVLNFDQQGQVFSFESRVNLVAALMNVLHSPAAAIHAHQSSMITSAGHWQVEQNKDELARRERMLPRQLL